jgi:hypothetical protein
MNLVGRFDLRKKSNQSARDRCRITHPNRRRFGADHIGVRFAPKAALCGLVSNFRFNSEIRLNSEIAPCRLLAPEAEATVSVRAKTLAYAATPILTQNVPGYDPPSMRIF